MLAPSRLRACCGRSSEYPYYQLSLKVPVERTCSLAYIIIPFVRLSIPHYDMISIGIHSIQAVNAY
jgi:hypothetical protein